MAKYISLHKHRLQNEHGKVERKLVDEWAKLNNRGAGQTNILDSLFLAYCDKDDPERLARWEGPCPHPQKYPIGPPTDRDKIVAETVIQWLGTNIGREFLRQCGFKLGA